MKAQYDEATDTVTVTCTRTEAGYLYEGLEVLEEGVTEGTAKEFMLGKWIDTLVSIYPGPSESQPKYDPKEMDEFGRVAIEQLRTVLTNTANRPLTTEEATQVKTGAKYLKTLYREEDIPTEVLAYA